MKALLFAALLVLAPQNDAPSLESLEKQAAEQAKSGRPMLGRKDSEARLAAIQELLARDGVKTADELRRLSDLVDDPYRDFRRTRMRYELNLAAVVLGDQQAAQQVAQRWDALQVSLGRRQRFHSFALDGQLFEPDPAPRSIADVMADLEKARAVAAESADNPELKQLVDEDQAIRAKDWSALTVEDLEQMMRDDRARAKHVLEILADGAALTRQDFAAASLVLQHGEVYASYALAHECSLCALLLGDAQSAWLLAATYDRMLGACGQLQRYGTQYRGGDEGKAELVDVDPAGINDTVRKAMHCPTLEAARQR